MTLQVATVIIAREGRDKGGVFTLTEMPAEQAADWFMRAMQFLVRAGIDVPPNIFEAGPAGFLAIGIGTALSGLAKSPWHEVRPLLDELKGRVTSYRPPDGQIDIRGWPAFSNQIQEATTIFQLYEEVVSLSLGFSLAERLLSYRQLVTTTMAALTPNMETSTGSSPPSSEGASPA